MPEKEMSRQDCLDEIAAIDEVVPVKFRRRQLAARVAAMDFIEAHPEFVAVSEKLATVVDWLVAHELEPTISNFAISAGAMAAAGLLITEEESGDAPQEPSLTLADVEALSADEYRRRMLREPGFSAKVEALLAACPQRPRLRPTIGTSGAQRTQR